MYPTKYLRIAQVAVLLTAVPIACAQELYVSHQGSDVNPGTEQAPLATLQRARDAIRERRAADAARAPTKIIVRAGTYLLDKPLYLTQQDSGTPSAPVTYQALNGEHVSLIGGRRVMGWKPYQGEIMQADLAEQGLGGVRFKILVFGRQRMQLAR